VASERFGPYRIEGMIGRGSMGEVHRATDLRKERTVALKRLSVAHSGDEGFATRFRREAEMTARLHEPHVIPIHDYGEIDGQLYLDMRLVEGIDLSGAIAASGPLDPQRAVAVVEQVAAALDAAHRAALIHRDVKPSNILLAQPEGSGPEFAYLIDFGIAASLRDSRLTEQSTLIGTAAYMAPERFMPGAGGDHRVDVYALGCVLHETLVGKQPFPSGSIHQLMHAHVHEPAPRPGSLRAGLPQALDEVVAIAMAKDPDQRYQRAGELAAAARAAVSGVGAVVPGSPSSPTIPGAGGPAGSAGAAGSAAAPGRSDSTDEFARPALSGTKPGTRPGTAPGTASGTQAPPPSSPPSRRPRLWLVAAVLLALVVLGGTGYLLARDYLPGNQAAPPGPAAARLPDGLVGTWNGTQNEPASGRDFGVRVDLTSGAVGERVGEMSFSVFDCRFDLVLNGVQGTTDMAARPIAGPCSEGVVRATEAGPDRFTYETLAGDQVVATGDLTRG
jgi:serine/threonine protein kinase